MTTEYYMPQHYMEYSQYDYTYQPPYVPLVQHDRDDAFNGLQKLSEQIRLMNEQLVHLEEGEGQIKTATHTTLLINNNNRNHRHHRRFKTSCMSKERSIS